MPLRLGLRPRLHGTHRGSKLWTDTCQAATWVLDNHEDRSCTAPTAARVFDHFADVQRHHLTRDQQHIQVFKPQLTPLQQQLLDLPSVPASANLTTPGP